MTYDQSFCSSFNIILFRFIHIVTYSSTWFHGLQNPFGSGRPGKHFPRPIRRSLCPPQAQERSRGTKSQCFGCSGGGGVAKLGCGEGQEAHLCEEEVWWEEKKREQLSLLGV